MHPSIFIITASCLWLWSWLVGFLVDRVLGRGRQVANTIIIVEATGLAVSIIVRNDGNAVDHTNYLDST